MKKFPVVYFFPGKELPLLSEVGGKGLSLIQGAAAGFPVPGGFVLTASFFSGWFEKIKSTEIWQRFLNSKPENWQEICNELKIYSSTMHFDSSQEKIISDAISNYKESSLFAVRSSSPEEDLDGNSFAGGYETVLGVTLGNLKKALKTTFASCLDYRVFVYKKENGFNITEPNIAVVVQEQIPSEVSGVAFSINPVTNNFDEIVVNSNWGLGETVVSGIVTPDTYIIDKITGKINSYIKGRKEQTIRLSENGGTENIDNFDSDKQTLSVKYINELGDLVKKVEIYYGKPIDTEWALYEEKIYLLQARPITAFVPLSKEMQTKPGELKYLYMDATISIQGLYKPMSVFSTSLFRLLVKYSWKRFFYGDVTLNSKTSLVWLANGRMYSNLTIGLKLIGKDKFISFIKNMDSIVSRTLENIDFSEYQKPDFSVVVYKLRIAWILLHAFPYILKALIVPEKTIKTNNLKLENFKLRASNLLKKEIAVDDFIKIILKDSVNVMFKYAAPAALFARFVLSKIVCKLENKIDSDELSYLSQALPNNITTEMGLDLYKLSKLIPPNLSENDFCSMFKENKLTPELKQAVESYLYKYGHRCVAELDPATKRYRDLPENFAKFVFSVKSSEKSFDPVTNFMNLSEKRKNSVKKICGVLSEKSKLKAKMFKFTYRFAETFAGTREAHKYYLIYAIDIIRQRLLIEGEKLVKAGRLDSQDQIFNLTIENITKALAKEDLDLRSLSEKNTSFIKQLEKVPKLPSLFNSRGTILRPALGNVSDKNILVGMPVSSGIAKAKVKTLNSPTEKSFEEGEILVAKATDPAWTPLFVKASAVILEVGGLLQHGALVAREYGLPCVAGIENATSVFKDGEFVEVDGAAGTIKKLSN